MPAFIKDIIRQVILTQDGSKWPTFDGGTLSRSDFVTASEAANCSRRLSFEKTAERNTVPDPYYWDRMSDDEFQERLDAMPDDHKQGIFERGHHMELWVEEKLREGLEPDREVLLCSGKHQLSFYDAAAKVSGTPDGMVLNTEDRTISFIEVKSTDNRVTAPRSNHVSQTQVNMGIVQSLINDRKLFSVQGWNLNNYNVIGGSILYINPSNYLTMDEFWLDFDDGEALGKAAAKAARLFIFTGNGLQLPENLPPEGLAQWGGCTFCAFKSPCALIEELRNHEDTAKKLRAMANGQPPSQLSALPFFAGEAKREEVLKVIADYDAFNKAEKDAKAHKDALKGAIVEWVKSQDGMKAAFEDNGRLFKVSVSVAERVGSIDTDSLSAFLAKHDEKLDNFRKAGTKVETLLVKVQAD